jgi:hypothetical protein
VTSQVTCAEQGQKVLVVGCVVALYGGAGGPTVLDWFCSCDVGSGRNLVIFRLSVSYRAGLAREEAGARLAGNSDGRLPLVSLCLPFRAMGLVVVDDDVGELVWADCFEVELLGWYVAASVALLGVVGGHERGLVSGPGAVRRGRESSGHEYAQLP